MPSPAPARLPMALIAPELCAAAAWAFALFTAVSCWDWNIPSSSPLLSWNNRSWFAAKLAPWPKVALLWAIDDEGRPRITLPKSPEILRFILKAACRRWSWDCSPWPKMLAPNCCCWSCCCWRWADIASAWPSIWDPNCCLCNCWSARWAPIAFTWPSVDVPNCWSCNCSALRCAASPSAWDKLLAPNCCFCICSALRWASMPSDCPSKLALSPKRVLRISVDCPNSCDPRPISRSLLPSSSDIRACISPYKADWSIPRPREVEACRADCCALRCSKALSSPVLCMNSFPRPEISASCSDSDRSDKLIPILFSCCSAALAFSLPAVRLYCPLRPNNDSL